jgi:hypothetical protein
MRAVAVTSGRALFFFSADKGDLKETVSDAHYGNVAIARLMEPARCLALPYTRSSRDVNKLVARFSLPCYGGIKR